MYAIDTSGTTNPTPSVNIIVTPADAPDNDLPQAYAALRAQYQKAGFIIIGNPSTVQVAAHKALQVKLELPLTQASRDNVSITETQTLVAAHDFLYIVTFAGTSPDFSTIESAFSVS